MRVELNIAILRRREGTSENGKGKRFSQRGFAYLEHGFDFDDERLGKRGEIEISVCMVKVFFEGSILKSGHSMQSGLQGNDIFGYRFCFHIVFIYLKIVDWSEHCTLRTHVPCT